MRHELSFLLVATVLCAAASAAPRDRRDFDAVMALRADARRGEEVFVNCVSCHGVDGAGQATGSVPRIAGQHYRVLVRQIIDFRHGKRWDPRMEGVAASHAALPGLQDIADVARFNSEMTRDGNRGVGDGEHVELGAALYAAQCASCHGSQGEGDDARGIPRLAGQHAAYLSRQIYDAVDGRRPALSRTHGKRLAPLDFQQVRGLADWLSRAGRHPAATRTDGPGDSAPLNAP